MDVRIAKLKREHVAGVVRVHLRSFPGFFLTFLGPQFLAEFYRSFTEDPAGMGYAALDEEAGRVVGSVVGPISPAGYFKRLLKRRWWAFAAASLATMLRDPRVVRRLLRALVYRGDAPSGPARALLSSISVDPSVQGTGVGRRLVEAWAREARDRGAAGCFLTTDAENNEAVNQFYQAGGWTLESSYVTPEGRRMNRYVLDFEPDNQDV